LEKIIVKGGNALVGEVAISGAKNAALPLMSACLLSSEPITITNMPHLADISTMALLLGSLGVKVSMDSLDETQGSEAGKTIILDASNITNFTAEYDIVRKMRASVLVLGPMLARFGHARVSLPGGCAIGTRPVDMHLKALELMGVEIELEEGYVIAKAPDGGLMGAEITFDKVSVGATENILMAAALARGETVLHNAAREPEIVDLATLLRSMGAAIEGDGTSVIRIQGVPKLHGAKHRVVADRIEAGTFAIAAAITGGDIVLKGLEYSLLGSVFDKLKEIGVEVEPINCTSVQVRAHSNKLANVDISTEPFPGFPTDMQAQFMTLLAIGDGTSTISENIFENRFMHVSELLRMGADISLNGHTAVVRGIREFKGASVMATDLRASSSLILAGLAAKGETSISRVYHLDRGYERIEEKLSKLGADISRVGA